MAENHLAETALPISEKEIHHHFVFPAEYAPNYSLLVSII
jgi:hypothetical protein